MPTLIKLLILEMLFDDDEPLNLVMKNAIITENNRYFIKEHYQNEEVDSNKIKETIKKLLHDNMVALLNENGEKLIYEEPEIDTILDSNEEWKFWLRVNKKGKQFFNDNYEIYFRSECFNSEKRK